MVYETSYETGNQPFRPDVKRGYWASPNDYIWASLALVFKIDIFFMTRFYFLDGGLYCILPYLICLCLYVVPIMIIQAFMGQFSSSGFISSLRLSPIFKGIGYVSLLLNSMVLSYYTIFGAVALFFMAGSLLPTLPWSPESWNHHNDSLTNSTELDTEFSRDWDIFDTPAELFFNSHFNALATEYNPENISISFEVILSILGIWIIIAVFFYYCRQVGDLGRYLRYAVWTVLVLLTICLIRFAFLPNAINSVKNYFKSKTGTMSALTMPMFAMNAFGGGWGTIVTLASYNNFKVDIMSNSWIIGLGQMFIMIGINVLFHFIQSHLLHDNIWGYFSSNNWMLYIKTANVITRLELSHLWSLLFFGMLTLSAIIVMVTQLLILLTSIFDEFEAARAHKNEVTFSLIALFATFSLYLCANHDVGHFTFFFMDALFANIILNLLLLLLALWIYGRQRFQRDIEFMLKKPFGTCRIYMVRFIAPLCLLYTFGIAGMFGIHATTSTFYIVISLLPWLFIPGFAIYLVAMNTGSICTRIKRTSRPNDWYPVETEDRQSYEEAMGNLDITHQLTEVTNNEDNGL